jgi:hypothetical protein
MIKQNVKKYENFLKSFKSIDSINSIKLTLSKFHFTSYLKPQKQLPYIFSGMRFANNSNPSEIFEEFYESKLLKGNFFADYDYEDENYFFEQGDNLLTPATKIYFIPNFFKSIRFNLKYSKEFYNAMNDLHFNYVKNLVEILNCENSSTAILTDAKSSLRKILNENFYKKLLFEENSFLFKTRETHNKTKLILHKDEKNKNKFYLDKIFVHCNFDKNAPEKMILKKIENVANKNLIIFYYKKLNSSTDNSEDSSSSFLRQVKSFGNNFNFNSLIIDEKTIEKNFRNKLIVRFSVWAKISDNIIVDYKDEKELVHAYRIYDDEWHHILLEMEDDSIELRYLNVLNEFSFNRITMKLLNFINSHNSLNSMQLHNQLKIADFDFFMRGNPVYKKKIIFSDSSMYKDEFYFIKRRI